MYSNIVRLTFLLFAFLGATHGETFAIQIASPVAAQSYQMKRSAFVFRTTGCAAPEKPAVTATAEGQVVGKRRSQPLKVVPATTPGVYGVFREWPEEGVWIVNITARCGQSIAVALVATDGKTFIRESSTFLTHPANESEIEAAIKNAPPK